MDVEREGKHVGGLLVLLMQIRLLLLPRLLLPQQLLEAVLYARVQANHVVLPKHA